MSFAHPWMLLGALAALIPLLVHLFDRRRPRRQPFPPIAFVLRSQRRTASRLRLKRLLLYALRTLILLALPVALARPEWKADAARTQSAAGPAATAIILDASLSMRWKDPSPPFGKSAVLFERGRAEARQAVRDLLPEEPAVLVLCTPTPQAGATLGFDKARLLSQLDEAAPSFGKSDLNRCLDLGARLLEDSPLAGKRLVVVSDFTQTDLRLEAPAPTVTGPKGEKLKPEVVLRDVAAGAKALPNRAIVDLKVEPALQAGPRAFQFTFTVKNFSPEAATDLELSLSVDGKAVTKGFLDVPANGTATKALTHRFEGGGTAVVTGALTPDALVEDDVRSTVVAVPRPLRALVVNGAPSPQKFRDEAFFTEAALTAPGSPLTALVRDADAAWREDFKGYDVVLLLNAPPPPPDVAARLAEWVQAGGGLFLSVGDRAEPEAMNAALGPLLPRPLRVLKTAVEPGASDANARAARLSQVSTTHPVLSPFTGQAREGLFSARFFRHMLLEAEAPGAANPSEVLAALDDGAPILAAARVGKGRVLLFTSTVDRDWSDFSIRTSFLPFMQRAAAWLAGALEERALLRANVGEALLLQPEAGVEVSGVRAPSGAELTVLKQPDGTLKVGPVAEAGAHLVLAPDGAVLPTLSFAAVLDSAESDLARLDASALESWFGEETVKAAGESGGPTRLPLWTWLIAVAALAFFFEGVLLRK